MRRAIAWLERGGRVLVVRRTGTLLEGLWEPPGVELEPREDARTALVRVLRDAGAGALRLEDSGARVKHAITHRAIEVEVWRGRLARPSRRSVAARWVSLEAPEVGLTALTRKAARALVAHASRSRRG